MHVHSDVSLLVPTGCQGLGHRQTHTGCLSRCVALGTLFLTGFASSYVKRDDIPRTVQVLKKTCVEQMHEYWP